MRKYYDKLEKMKFDEFSKKCEEHMTSDKKMIIITANPEIFVKALKNEQLDEMLISSEVTIVPDGIGIVKGGNFLGYDIPERITGVDLTERLLEIAHNYHKSLYLVGATSEVLSDFINLIHNKYSNIVLVGHHDGYAYIKEEVEEEIRRTRPDLCLVALGVPSQEILINQLHPQTNKGIFVGVGGSFDVISGNKKRAPELFIKLNLEWLYRIVKEPKRIRRFIDNNLKFISEIVKIKMN